MEEMLQPDYSQKHKKHWCR